MNIKAFMKEELKDLGTMEFPGVDTFVDEEGKPIPLIIKRLSTKRVKEIREMYKSNTVYRDKRNGDRPIIGANGQVAVLKEYDADAAGMHMMVEAFVQPKLDDPELMEYYGVLNRLDMPQTIFAKRSDFMYADECLSTALGIRNQQKETEKVEEIKN